MPLTKLFRQWMVDCGTVLKTRVNTGDFVLESGWVPAIASRRDSNSHQNYFIKEFPQWQKV